MASPVKTATTKPIRHEEYCLPRPGADAPRIESYPYYEEDLARGGRSRPTYVITRCVECGAQTNTPIGA